jgi:hypothetical protein
MNGLRQRDGWTRLPPTAPAAAIERVIEIFAKTSEETGAKLRDAIDPKFSK